jgi:ABC-type branched-subunit amino acid transport system substrate-binding protein
MTAPSRMQQRAILLLGALMLVAAACGTALSDEQAASELRAEGAAGRSDGAAAAAVGEPTSDSGATGGGSAPALTSDGASGVGASSVKSASGEPASAANGPARSAGGATDVGVSAAEINLGWVGTLGGPVPGAFRGALVATHAWINYQNSRGGLMGRQLKLIPCDDGLDSARNRACHLQLKDKVFSFVGSFAITDDGGAPVLNDCKCPDISGNLSAAMHASPYHFAPQPSAPGWRSGPPKYYAKKFGKEVIEHTAFFYTDIPVTKAIADQQRRVYEKAGFKIVYQRGLAPNDINQTADVVQMKRAGVRAIVFQTDLDTTSRLTAAMKQQNFKVDLLNLGNSVYDQNAFKVIPPSDLQNLSIDQVYGMFLGEDAARIPEVRLFNEWMKKTDPQQPRDLFALYAWLSGRLFGDSMLKMSVEGKNPVRAELINTLKSWGSWDGYGLVAPIKVGTKTPSDCFFVFTATADAKFQRTFPENTQNYICDVGPFDPKP